VHDGTIACAHAMEPPTFNCMSEENEAEFEGLAAAHRDQVYRQMLRLCGNKEDAEDVLTDALLAAYRRLDTLREREAFGAWLAQIARRLCFHMRSQQRIRAELSLDELQTEGFEPETDSSLGPEERLLVEELRAAVRGAIGALPEELRAVYTMRDMEERSGDATALALNISVAAMKSRLHRARGQVRARLDRLFAQTQLLEKRRER